MKKKLEHHRFSKRKMGKGFVIVIPRSCHSMNERYQIPIWCMKVIEATYDKVVRAG